MMWPTELPQCVKYIRIWMNFEMKIFLSGKRKWKIKKNFSYIFTYFVLIENLLFDMISKISQAIFYLINFNNANNF